MDKNHEISLVAERYRADGYEVKALTNGVQLPPFAAGFRLDLFATKAGEKVLVQVKQGQKDLEKDSTTADMARVINAQPGWRFDLVVLGDEDAIERIVREGEEPSAESLSLLLDHAERTAKAGDTPSAFIRAWAALEAAMRRAARTAALEVASASPLFLLGALYSNGLLERQEYDELNNYLRLRNAVVHGLEVPAIDSTVPLYVASVARKLLACDGTALPVS
jgi:hypothetical protein